MEMTWRALDLIQGCNANWEQLLLNYIFSNILVALANFQKGIQCHVFINFISSFRIYISLYAMWFSPWEFSAIWYSI